MTPSTAESAAPHDLPLRHRVGHLHALAGIAHRWLHQDGVLRRMVPGREN